MAEGAKPSLWERLKAAFAPAGGSESDGRMAAPVYPKAVDTGHQHRREAWMIRILAVIASFEALTIAALGFAIASIVPLKRVDLALLQVSNSGEQVVEVKPLRVDLPALEVATRSWVIDYVKQRNTVVPDQKVMDDRIRFVRERSSAEVFREYAERNRNFLPQAVAQRLARNVTIKVVTRDKSRNAIWFVDFLTTDTFPGADPATRSFRAQLVVDFKPRLTTAGDLERLDLMNPFGFTVQRYDVSGLADPN